ncbi:MAG: gamma-glutamyl kinase [Rhodobacterales bacterium]|nr:MAG: gamma-glutamyl kinase [Rhodobacterales bacterium]
MLVFSKAKLVLLATPKTGSTALHDFLAPHADVAALNPPGMKHMPAYRYQRFFVPLLAACGLKNLHTMAFIREPVDWLSSWYRYRSRPALIGHKNSTAEMDFDSFVRAYMQEERPPYADVGSQFVFLSGLDGESGVNHLFRYEEMDGAVAFLSRRLGIEIALEQKNVSPQRPAELSPETREQLQDHLAHEFNLWQQARCR